MNKRFFSRTFFGICIFLSTLFLGRMFWQVQAFTAVSESSSVVETNSEGKPGPHFFSDGEITLSGRYRGPVFAAGGLVEFLGETTEDLVVAGGTVRVSGVVGQDLYAAGGSVVVDGVISGNLILAGAEVQIRPGSEIGGSIIAAGQRVRMQADVPRSSWLAGESIFVSSFIDGDLQLAGESVQLTESASIAGNLHAVLDEDDSSYRDASVAGEVKVRTPEEKVHEGPANEIAGLVYSFLWRFLFLGVAWLMFAEFLQRSQTRVIEQPGKMAITGALWWAAVPLLALLLFVSIIGVPLALLLIAALIIVGLFAWTIPALALVARFLPSQSPWLRVVVVAAVLAVLGALPILGTVAHVIMLVLGTGALWVQFRSGSRKVTEKKTGTRKGR